LGTFLKALKWDILVCFMATWLLRLFGEFYVHFVKFVVILV
jgi:hypothetical protein